MKCMFHHVQHYPTDSKPSPWCFYQWDYPFIDDAMLNEIHAVVRAYEGESSMDRGEVPDNLHRLMEEIQFEIERIGRALDASDLSAQKREQYAAYLLCFIPPRVKK